MSAILTRSDATRVPLVFDSPHSGTSYPPDFDYVCEFKRLRRAEDTFVDLLFGAAVGYGAGLVTALFPRSYIDVNRSLDDIDEELFDAAWPEPIRPGEKTAAGMGLIRRLSLPGEPIYDRQLSVAEGQHRIDTYYRPYHAALQATLDAAHDRWGRVFYVDCHSMKEFGNAMNTDAGARRPDFVLGDRDGTTCDPDFVDAVRTLLMDRGYTVTVNQPYKGVELVRRHGRPDEGRHALQVEINRALYLVEEELVPNPRFAETQATCTALIEHLARWVSERG